MKTPLSWGERYVAEYGVEKAMLRIGKLRENQALALEARDYRRYENLTDEQAKLMSAIQSKHPGYDNITNQVT